MMFCTNILIWKPKNTVVLEEKCRHKILAKSVRAQKGKNKILAIKNQEFDLKINLSTNPINSSG